MLSRDAYDQFRVSAVDPATIRWADVEATLVKLVAAANGRIKLEKFDDSFLGRPIYLATIGSGPRRVLLWSQMHGDEPTHTAVLLDLLSYLTRTPAEPHAEEILAGSTLLMIPMLNPDGAEVVSRFNAQGIDINRDARRLATPEGRALRRAVETLKPEFGFNLHNQNARTSVGGPARPAAVSVLAPPPDKARTESPAMLRAKQMCACFVEAVRPHAEGMISRYDDTYEPRAFGDTIQSMGTATMLVEGGGWPEPHPEPLTRLHFHGMLQTLRAIATDRYRQADLEIYTSLPESNSFNLFDCMIKDALILDGEVDVAFKADLGIDQSHGRRFAFTAKRDGRITEIGDLGNTAGKTSIDANGFLVMPGRIAFFEELTPTTASQPSVFDAHLAAGATTIIGCVDIQDRAAVEAIAAVAALPLNVGFVARLDNKRSVPPSELVERVLAAVSRGVLAVLGENIDGLVRQYLDWFGVPVLRRDQLPSSTNAASYADYAKEASKLCKLFSALGNRGHIARDAFADLQFFSADTPVDTARPAEPRRLRRVMVSGETVWENGKPTGSNPGVLVRRR